MTRVLEPLKLAMAGALFNLIKKEGYYAEKVVSGWDGVFIGAMASRRLRYSSGAV